MVVFGFSSGGFFARTQGIAAVAYAIAAIVALAISPAERLPGRLLLACAAWWSFAGWTLLSGLWSHSSSRAIIEFERVVLYANALVLFALLARGVRGVVNLLGAVLAACLVLCSAALMMRLAPDVFAFGVDQRSFRLQYPITYANTLGLIAVLGGVLAFGLAADPRRHPAVKILGAAATPLFATTLLLTYSRGAMLAGAAALAVFFIAGLSGATIGALLATGGTSAVAALTAYHADLLASADFASPRALSEGHHVALVLAAGVVLAALLRGATLGLDRWLERTVTARWAHAPSRPGRRFAVAAGGAAAVLAAVLLVIALPALQRGYESFSQPGSVQTKDVRARLTELQGNDRAQAWHVALADFRSAPVLGTGAGTFVLSWDRSRTVPIAFDEAHSLYLQMLGELGLVGAGLLVLGLAAIGIGLARAARSPDRVVFVAGLAAAVGWAVAAALDWQWQMPVGTIWLFAVAGAALAAAPVGHRVTSRVLRLLGAIALAAAALLPARVAIAEGHLARSVSAFRARDCPSAVKAAAAARSALGALPEPYVVLGYCAAIAGTPSVAVRYEEEAVSRDPDNWTFRYALADVDAVASRDPRPAARAALDLNPLEPQVRAMARLFAGSDPRQWRRQAALVPVVLPSALD